MEGDLGEGAVRKENSKNEVKRDESVKQDLSQPKYEYLSPPMNEQVSL